MTLQSDGTHYKLTKLNNSMQLNKVIIGKDAANLPMSKHNQRGNKHNKGQLIHNSNLKFSNKRNGSNSPSPVAAHLPFQIAPPQANHHNESASMAGLIYEDQNLAARHQHSTST